MAAYSTSLSPTTTIYPSNMQEQQTSSSSRPARSLPRFPSYSKRHASFNSPREVPLPSPTISLAENSNPFSFSTTAHQASSSKAQDAFENNSSQPQSPSSFAFDTPGAGSSSRPRSPASPQDDSTRRHRYPHNRKPSIASSSTHLSSDPTRESIPLTGRVNHHPTENSEFAPVYTSSRPFSLPEAQSSSYSSTLNSYFRHTPPTTPSANVPHMSTTWLDRYSSASLPLPSQVPFYALPKVNTNPGLDLNSGVTAIPSSLSPPSSSTEVAFSGSGSGTRSPMERPGLHCPAVDESSSSSSSSSSSRSVDSIATTNSSFNTEVSVPSSDKPSFAASLSPTFRGGNNLVNPDHRNEIRPAPRPVSPFRAPQPPPQTTRAPTSDFNTAMRRFMPRSPSTSSFPPPEPPVILPAESGDDMTLSTSRSQAPYVSFLSHAPPPPDSWIEVETTLSEYRLHVRLPGFSREGITLATKRRRILHVVADSYGNDGGHFERRISFGYDADLVQVRAEFDGVMLRITVPRRISPVILHSPRPGPTGRV